MLLNQKFSDQYRCAHIQPHIADHRNKANNFMSYLLTRRLHHYNGIQIKSLWIPLSVNLFRLESSILTRAKRARRRNNVATKNESKKKVLAPDSPGAQVSGAKCPAPNRRRRNVPDPILSGTNILVFFSYSETSEA